MILTSKVTIVTTWTLVFSLLVNRIFAHRIIWKFNFDKTRKNCVNCKVLYKVTSHIVTSHFLSHVQLFFPLFYFLEERPHPVNSWFCQNIQGCFTTAIWYKVAEWMVECTTTLIKVFHKAEYSPQPAKCGRPKSDFDFSPISLPIFSPITSTNLDLPLIP